MYKRKFIPLVLLMILIVNGCSNKQEVVSTPVDYDFYDKYDRSKKTKVYLGEYATHIPGRKANIETALTEALYLAALERNGDVVLLYAQK